MLGVEGRGTDAVALQGFTGQDYAFLTPPAESALAVGQTGQIQARGKRADTVGALGVKSGFRMSP